MIKFNNYKKEGTNDSMYRKSGGDLGIDTGIGTIANIKGNTVAWNQQSPLMNVGGFAIPSWSFENCTNVISSDGRQVDITFTSATNLRYRMFAQVIANHKYFVRCYTKISSDCPIERWSTTGFMNTKIISEGSVGSFSKFAYIKTATESTTGSVLYPATQDYSGATFSVKDFIVVDLTLIYGDGNEPTNPEQFESDYFKWFGKPLTYESYDAGSLRSVQLDAIKTTGFNQWDEEWEMGIYDSQGQKLDAANAIRSKNKYRVVPNSTYYVSLHSRYTNGLIIRFYDINGNCISTSVVNNDTIVSPADCFEFALCTFTDDGITTYNHDICININNPSKNGTYAPYEEHVAPIPVTTLTDKLNGQGESVAIFPDGMKSADTIADEIYTVADKTYAVKRVGSVDLGGLTWNGPSSNGRFSAILPELADRAADAIANLVCSIYIPDSFLNMYTSTLEDRNMHMCQSNGHNNHAVSIKNLSYTDTATFKSAMNGVILYYELETPLVYEVEGFTLPKTYLVDGGGTEEQVQKSGVQGLAAPINTIYNNDVAKMIKNNTEIKKVYKGKTLIWEKPQ